MYRDLKLRGSIIKDRQLLTLPLEQIYDKVWVLLEFDAFVERLGLMFSVVLVYLSIDCRRPHATNA